MITLAIIVTLISIYGGYKLWLGEEHWTEIVIFAWGIVLASMVLALILYLIIIYLP